MTKEETMQHVAEELRAEICGESGVPEEELAGIQVRLNSTLQRWEVEVTSAAGQRATIIPLASAVARHLASPLKPSPEGSKVKIPAELLTHARIEPALRYLGIYGFGIGTQDERRLADWVYERQASIHDRRDESNRYHPHEKDELDPYYPGEILRCAGVVAAVLCSEIDHSGFADRWADFRGEEFQPDAAAAYGEKWHRLSAWDTARVAFQKHLSTACIGAEKWLTLNQLRKQWHGLKVGLVAAAATYSTEGTQLQIRSVPACQCPSCGKLDLVRSDNTCSGSAYGHRPHICAYETKPEGGQRDVRVSRIIAKVKWTPAQTWKCPQCRRLFFLPHHELARQRATAILRVLDEHGAPNAASAGTDAITKAEIEKFVAEFRRSRRDDQERLRDKLEKQRRAAAYPCPNCGATGGWFFGATFWIPAGDRPPPELRDKYAGFQRPPDQDDGVSEVDRLDRPTPSSGEADQVIERYQRREVVARLWQRLTPGTAEYLFAQVHFLEDLPVSLKKKYAALPSTVLLAAAGRLRQLVREIEAKLEQERWHEDWEDEKPGERPEKVSGPGQPS